MFDFDGLILETEMPVFVGWQEEFLAHGSEPLTFELWSAEIGTNRGLDLVALLRETATQPVDEVAMHERRRARIDELVALEELRPGVDAWLDEADALGLRLAVASSSPTDWVEPHLVRLGIRDRFEHVVCRRRRACRQARARRLSRRRAAQSVSRRDAALAVEDSPHGVRAREVGGVAVCRRSARDHRTVGSVGSGRAVGVAGSDVAHARSSPA